MTLAGLLATVACSGYTLQLMPEAVEKGAVCLSGSPAGYYIQPSPADSVQKNNWLIFFEGGGWCYDARDCYVRSKGAVGDSSHWGQSSGGMGGLLNVNCDVSPDFCHFNHVYVMYCDGTSWTGNADNPVVFNNTQLFFRGKRILDAVLESLAQRSNLTKAENVLISGSSAGSLATYLNADRIHSWFVANAPGLVRFKVMPISGFFLDHESAYGVSVYRTQMENMHAISNATFGGALHPGCVAKYLPAGEDWKCSFAQYVYDFIEAPIFILNSVFDAWQMMCIYTAELPPGFPNQQGDENGLCGKGVLASCQANPDTKCSAGEIEELNQYSKDFMSAVSQTNGFYRPGNGAFLSSCHTHSEARYDQFFNNITIGGVVMSEAVRSWWNSSRDPSSTHTYLPCLRSTGNSTASRLCNPTCGKDITAAEVLRAFYS
ncbi:Pectin acetylesterase 3 [Diplonema papillatum]|nr:Pectin acetylesterase 3 [Diplonema papillatum]|eukprot:gene15137-23123_t